MTPSKKIINKWYHGAGAFHWLVKRTCGFNSLMENVVVEVHSVLSEIRVHISAYLIRRDVRCTGCYLGKVKRKICLHARVAAHSVTLQAKYFTSQIEKKCFQIWQINVLGNETIVLALVESIAKITTVFLKELSSTLLYPFLKPGVYVGKHAHKSSWIN